jgi:nicotinate-nucleotide pyrophosphorylase (carboxylating)
MNAKAQIEAVSGGRETQLRKALFRGEALHTGNAQYREAVAALLDPLLRSDAGGGDLTVEALGLGQGSAKAQVLAREAGVVAGLEEFQWLLDRGGMTVRLVKKDGEAMRPGEVLAEVEGQRGALLSYERTGLNLLQRMGGVASLTRRLQERVQRRNPKTFVVGTRKTPWGLLDKRAVHLGGGGTHRLSLSDAILVKNNHLALLAEREEEAVERAIEKAWAFRGKAGFIEVEVRSAGAALAGARAFRALQEKEKGSASCPCLLLLDNMTPGEARRTVEMLETQGVRENAVIELSGNIEESNLDEYAVCGADALSMGALTHSPRALDVSMRIS